jgi:hypothetical protein
MKTSRRTISLHPLAACLALAFGAPDAGAVPHATFVVDNCLDSGPGSLRQAVIDDVSGEPIDLTGLSCSLITLTSGRIEVPRAQLIRGPGSGLLTIDGNGNDRVFNQNGAFPLALYGMTVQNGYTNTFGGGCVYSSGSLQLNDTVVRDCHVFDIASSGTYEGGGVRVHDDFVAIRSSIVDNEIYSTLGIAIGGGAVVGGNAILDHSTVSGNVVSNGSGNVTSVGGIDVTGQLFMMYSTISDNLVQGLPATPGSIGGARAAGGASITNSTISGNSADGGVGGLHLYGSDATPVFIAESTISGNTSRAIGGMYARGTTTIRNSTIAFNGESASTNGGGLRVAYALAEIDSTIIAANTSAGGEAQNVGLGISGGITGTHDLIGSSPSVLLPSDNIGGDPHLLPLADNGGPTRTHALRPGSAAIDAGDDGGDTVDQRGTGFPRVVGDAADIGAFEGVDADSIFFDGFE